VFAARADKRSRLLPRWRLRSFPLEGNAMGEPMGGVMIASRRIHMYPYVELWVNLGSRAGKLETDNAMTKAINTIRGAIEG
jgi:hypothetical protein